MNLDERKWNIFYLTSKDIEDYLKHDDMIVVPLGSTEQHGHHLPLGTDSIQGLSVTSVACGIAKVLHTPPIWTGYSPHHLIRAGTITLRAGTLQNLAYDVARSLIHSGFNKIIFYLAHGSNVKIIDPLLRKIKYDTGAFVALFEPDMEYSLVITKDVWEGPPEETPGWHSGEEETSHIMAYDQSLVKMENAIVTKGHAPSYMPPRFSKDSADPYATFDGKYKVLYVPLEHSEVTETGVIGNPFRATKEKGEKSIQMQGKVFAEVLNELRKVKIVAHTREFKDRI